LAVVGLIGVSLFQIHNVSAGWTYGNYSDSTDQDLYGYPVHYPRVRYISYADYGIALYKEDGPKFYAQAWGCNGCWQGDWHEVSNSDPAPLVFLKANGSTPHSTFFCMALQNNTDNYGTFTGWLNWDG
jgi:hypothetical protein